MKPLSLGKANKFSLFSLIRGYAPHKHYKDRYKYEINNVYSDISPVIAIFKENLKYIATLTIKNIEVN